MSAESGDEKLAHEQVITKEHSTFRYFLMVSTFDFRFQKEKCVIWLGFVFFIPVFCIPSDHTAHLI